MCVCPCVCVQIGTEFLRGVSGGERKRCSIGMELITSPSLLFLDEPTTGLDSNTANCIVALLHRCNTTLNLINYFDQSKKKKTNSTTYLTTPTNVLMHFQAVQKGKDCDLLHPPASLLHLQTV